MNEENLSKALNDLVHTISLRQVLSTHSLTLEELIRFIDSGYIPDDFFENFKN